MCRSSRGSKSKTTELDFNLLPDTEEVHSTFLLREKNSGYVLSDVLELHYVELRKFKPAKPQELRTRFERWLYFLKFADLYGPEDIDLPDNLQQEEGIVMALESLRRAYAKDPIRELIEAREKAERDDLNRIYTARLEGKLEGKLEGRLEGKLEGKLEVARNMLAAGMDRETVLRTTGLSEDDLPVGG
ncbi:MAG: Rpn family recombination-promoting nuclease/putative transposase [Vulcanimicrobiota bacterium]